MFSYDQIAAMRKTITSSATEGRNTAAKKEENKKYSYQD